jgi:tetratricopeptide (TPR) repeat protein
LDTNAQKVMQALAVYNRPVTPAAVDYLLAPHIPAIDSAPILQRLANMHFARKESGRFYLHPVDREFAVGLIPEGDLNDKIRSGSGLRLLEKYMEITNDHPDLFESQEAFEKAELHAPLNFLRDVVTSLQNLEPSLQEKLQDNKNFEDQEYLRALDQAIKIPQAWTRYALTNRAADYFAQARKPRAEWKKLDDLSAQLAEFDLRCTAGDYDTAASVLLEIDFDYLFLWGHYRLMIELHEKLQEKIIDELLRSYSIGNLGSAYYSIGYVPNAIKYYIKALEIDRENQNKGGEGTWLGNLGNCYARLGDVHKAIECYEQELIIDRELGDRNSEGGRLVSLGNRYFELGDVQKAIESHEQGLVILREFDNKNAISIAAENLGRDFLSIDEYEKAQENYLQAVEIADEISFPLEQNWARWGLAQAYLFQNSLPKARATIEAALQYDVPENNHNASALHGIIALRQGEEVTARGAFVRAIGQADEILSKTAEYYSALDAKGLAICGLILAGRGDPSMPAETNDGKIVPPDKVTVSTGRVAPMVDDAIETFRKARKIAPHAGVVKSVLRLFDELVKCDEEGILKGVREIIEGK